MDETTFYDDDSARYGIHPMFYGQRLFRGRLTSRPGPESCGHAWTAIAKDVPKDGSPPLQEYCRRCGATCLRERKTGLIEEYDRTAGFSLGQPRQDLAARQHDGEKRAPHRGKPRPRPAGKA